MCRRRGSALLLSWRGVEVGSVLDGKYRLLELIGRGGMGSVWRAQHLGLDSPVALKLMTPEMAANPDAVRRFTQEAKAAASLRSPHVVQILDYGVDPASREPFIAMELLEGESLSSRLRRCTRLSPSDTSRIIAHVARALTLAHAARIVHRDLKPDNIFLVQNGDEEIAKVLDFGIAKSSALAPGLQGQHAQTVTGSVLGTPYYMSPEQITNSKGVDHRSDLWSLAVIACECLTGKRPFLADSAMGLAVLICQGQSAQPSSLAPVPPGFDAWFTHGTALDRERRFQSASELAAALSALLGRAGTANADQRAAPASALAATEKAAVVAPARTVSAVIQPAREHAAPRPSWRAPALAALAALAAAGTVWALLRTPADAAQAEPLGAPRAAATNERGDVVPPPAEPPVREAPAANPAPAAAPPAAIVTEPYPSAAPVPSTSNDDAAPRVRALQEEGERASSARPAQAPERRAAEEPRQRVRPAPARPRKGEATRPKTTFDPYENL